jgi:addiction module toxin, RelE/StbE family
VKTPVYTRQFEKDVKLFQKRGYDFDKFKVIMRLLLDSAPLPEKCHPHKLSGAYSGFWDCHIAPDWILIYSDDAERIIFQRMDTHADLF